MVWPAASLARSDELIGQEMGLLDRILKAGRTAVATSDNTVEHAEHEAERLLEEGVALEQQGLFVDALARYETAISLVPDLPRAHFNRGIILLEHDQIEAALDAFMKAVALKPESAAAHYNVGNAQFRLGRTEATIAACQRAVALKPDFSDAYVLLGCALGDIGHFNDALVSYRQALAFKPDVAEVHFRLATLLKNIGQLDQAAISYRQTLKFWPDDVDAHYNLGVALHGLEEYGEALESYRKALEINPDYAEIYSSMGMLLHEVGRLDEAAASYRRALELKADWPEVLGNFGNVLKDLRLPEDAVASYRRVLEILPDDAKAFNNLGVALSDLGQFDEAVTSYRRALEIEPDFVVAHSNLLFVHNYLAEQPASLLLAEALGYGKAIARLATPYTVWPNLPIPDRPLRVGIVSGDLRAHPVGYFVESVLAALTDETSGKLLLFAYPSLSCYDEVTARIKSHCQEWHLAMGLSDECLAQRIRHDRIDILIDLAGHTSHNRLPLFAWKPAPVQISWLGYFATTGVAEIDYFVADPWVLLDNEEADFSEKIWRLPETRLCFTPPDVSLEVNRLPALNNGFVTFACFNNLSKMGDGAVALWARILINIPGSHMFLMAPQLKESAARQRVIDRFSAHGVDAERLILEAARPRAEYLAAYQQVDIALDPFPYTGGTTTVEALWMGVPVLTLAGQRLLSRQGVGLLMNAGLHEWVAADADDYVDRAVMSANDLPRLALLRTGLRQQVLASPIFDARRFAQHFDVALRSMWQTWCHENRASS